MNSAKDRINRLLILADVHTNRNQPWDMHVHDDRVYDRILAEGSLGLGESYMDGWWDSERVDQMVYRIITTNISERVAPLSMIYERAVMRLLEM